MPASAPAPARQVSPGAGVSRHALTFVLVTILLDTIGFGMLMPVMPKLIMALTGGGLSEASRDGGYLMFLFAVVNFFASPVLGNLGDRFGRRPILLVSLFVLGANSLLMGLAPTLIWLFIGRLFTGAAAATYSTANAYVADISPPDKRAQNFGMIGATFGLGFIIGPALGGVLGDLGARVPFLVAAGLAFVNVLYGYFVLPESLALEHRRAFDWKRANPLGAIRAIGKYPVVGALIVSVVLYQLAFQVMPSIWTFFTMHQFKWTPAQVGYSMAFTGVMMVLVQVILVRALIPRLGEFRAAVLGLALTCVAHVLYSLSIFGWMMYLGMVIGSMSGLVSPALNAIMSRQVGPSAQGELQGAVSCLVSLTTIVGPLLMTQLFSAFSAASAPLYFPGAPFAASALFIAISLVLLLRRAPR